MASGPLYLGFDLSTQQLKAIVVASDLSVVSQAKVDFDADFAAKYKINKGVLADESEGEVFAPVALWLEALDLVLDRLRASGCPMSRIKGISGSAQQHGSVFWNDKAEGALKGLDGSKTLLEQLGGVFAHPFAPNWQDHSTQAECDLFDAHLGDAVKLAEATGSSAHHRFTGTQIMRMRRKRPDVYKNSARISLVSSFLASLLLGAIAPIEISDVTGMNLWDIAKEQWSEPLLELTAGSKDAVPDLLRKLGEVPLHGENALGPICNYFVDKFGFSGDCQIAPFTGDNPATILALPLRPGDAIVSLGTSTTFLMNTATYKPDPSYHFMNHPTTKGHYMFMLCYKNGGLAREKVRNKLPKPAAADQDPWGSFNKAVFDTPPLDVDDSDNANRKAKLGLYFPLPEIVPNVRAGTWRYECAAKDGNNLEVASAEWTPEADARVIVESQALSLRLRSQSLVTSPSSSSSGGSSASSKPTPPQPRRVYLVGGGSLNPAIARVMGDVLGGVDGVYKLDVGGNACALGGAYKAVWTLERRAGESFDELIGKRWKEEDAIQKVDDGYRDGVFQRYGKVLGAFEEMEKRVLKDFKN